MSNIIYPGESYAIMGACFPVYKTMGCGFLESVYQECLSIEFNARGIPFKAKPRLEITYRDQLLNQFYEADFICFEKIIIELKAVSLLAKAHEAQVINYLSITKFELGILMNFGHFPKVETKRIIV